MSFVSGLERRGAVYYWRRRLPSLIAREAGINQLKLSLQTREFRPARFLAAQLDATAESVFMSQNTGITKEQLNRLFRKAFEVHREKLATIAAFSREDDGYNPVSDIHYETVMGWAYRIRSSNGRTAEMTAAHKQEMAASGVKASIIADVEWLLSHWRRTGDGDPSPTRLTDMLVALDVPPTASNRAIATPAYLRAIGEALLTTDQRYNSDPLPFDEFIANAVKPSAESLRNVELFTETEQRASRSAPASEPVVVAASPAPDEAVKTRAHSNIPRDVETVGKRLIEQNLRDNTWETKTARQAAATFDLLRRYLLEDHRLWDLRELRQHHLDGFAELLREIAPNYGKSPRDKTRSITALREYGATLPAETRGLAGGTRNRHLTFVGQLLRRARSAGIKLDPDLSASALRAKKQKRGRDQRVIPGDSSVAALFQAPVFTGCASWDKMHEVGNLVFHRAAYFGPMLAHYQGMRRDEFCGLAVADVINVHKNLPYIHVGPNTVRRVKNLQSVRNLTLHPELIRLGFLDYVEKMRSLGYERLFPDLYSASTKSPVGDRYYDELLPLIKEQQLTPHQMRHYFGNTLKQKGVQAEHRADLLGHGGGDETTERYCDAIKLEIQLKHIEQVAVVTSHLISCPIKPIPWVVEREAAPWSRGSR